MALLNRQFPQVSGMRGASEGSGQNSPLINPAMIYGHRPNSFPAQQLRNAPVQTPPSLIIAKGTRSDSERSGGTSLEAARAYHGHDQRSHSLIPATSQDVASTAHSCPQPTCSMGPLVTPTANRPRPDASGSTNQAGPSQNLGQQAPSGLAKWDIQFRFSAP